MSNDPAGLDELVKGWEGFPRGGIRPSSQVGFEGCVAVSTQRTGRENSAEKAQKPQSGDYSQVVGVPGAWRVLTGAWRNSAGWMGWSQTVWGLVGCWWAWPFSPWAVSPGASSVFPGFVRGGKSCGLGAYAVLFVIQKFILTITLKNSPSFK